MEMMEHSQLNAVCLSVSEIPAVYKMDGSFQVWVVSGVVELECVEKMFLFPSWRGEAVVSWSP